MFSTTNNISFATPNLRYALWRWSTFLESSAPLTVVKLNRYVYLSVGRPISLSPVAFVRRSPSHLDDNKAVLINGAGGWGAAVSGRLLRRLAKVSSNRDVDGS